MPPLTRREKDALIERVGVIRDAATEAWNYAVAGDMKSAEFEARKAAKLATEFEIVLREFLAQA
jgi:hypothetical protein